jgi:hypothetical protein
MSGNGGKSCPVVPKVVVVVHKVIELFEGAMIRQSTMEK